MVQEVSFADAAMKSREAELAARQSTVYAEQAVLLLKQAAVRSKELAAIEEKAIRQTEELLAFDELVRIAAFLFKSSFHLKNSHSTSQTPALPHATTPLYIPSLSPEQADLPHGYLANKDST